MSGRFDASRRAEVAAWLARVAGDLQVFDAVVVLKPTPPLLEAAFHLQQAAEKLLKATLVGFGQPVPKTHNLARLLALVGPGLTMPPELASEIAELTEWAVAGRYPDLETAGDPTADEVAAAREVVRRLREIVLAALDQG